jgi:hypothetical protein
MTPSEQLRNAERTVLAYLAATPLPWPLVPVNDARFNSATVPAFVRVQFQGLGDEPAGRVDGVHATLMRTLVTAECYARASDADEGSTIDLVDQMADTVASRLRCVKVPMKDYVTDPTGATSAGDVAIQFNDPPRIRALAPDAGWCRKTVSAPATWIARSGG